MSTLLACHDCGEKKFSWIVEMVQFGNMHEFENGERNAEAMESGPITESDTGDGRVYCTTCDEFKDVDDLVTPDD